MVQLGAHCVVGEVGVARWCPVGGEHDVDRTGLRHQVQGVVLRPQLDGDAREPGSCLLGRVEAGFEFVERSGEAFEVLAIACRGHVEVDGGWHGEVVNLGGDATDDDVPNAVCVQHADDGAGVELRHWSGVVRAVSVPAPAG